MEVLDLFITIGNDLLTVSEPSGCECNSCWSPRDVIKRVLVVRSCCCQYCLVKQYTEYTCHNTCASDINGYSTPKYHQCQSFFSPPVHILFFVSWRIHSSYGWYTRNIIPLVLFFIYIDYNIIWLWNRFRFKGFIKKNIVFMERKSSFKNAINTKKSICRLAMRVSLAKAAITVNP